MANDKKIIHLWGDTGLTLYCVIRREADGFLLNDADGAFAVAPADPYVAMIEDGTLKGVYEKIEARTVWNDGKYTVIVYNQVGGSPAPVSDNVIGSGQINIDTDMEVSIGDIRDRVDLILEDTGTTLPASLTIIDNEIEVIDGIVDSILIDTSVNIPAVLAALGFATPADVISARDLLLDAIALMSEIGTGPVPKTYTLTVSGIPCADVLVLMSTDEAGVYLIHSGRTNALGQITFYPNLPVGTAVYLWRYKTGVSFVNPDEELI